MAQKFLNGIDVSSTTVVNGSNLDSGSTVLDVQGSQGQLFSVTNSLTGDLFSVSDISGIPILNVNSSGLVTIDGALDSFNVTEFIKHEGDPGTNIQFLTGQMILKNSGGKYINLHSNNIMYFDASAYQFYSGNATFAGTIIATQNGGDASIYINNSRPSIAFTDSNSYADANDKYIVRGTSSDRLQFQWYDDSASTTTETFHINSSGNATFAGTVTSGTTVLTGDQTLPTDFVSAANGGTFGGNVNVLTGSTTGSITVGRNSNESTVIHVGDQVNSITAYQDADANATHNFTLNRVFGGTGANDFIIQKDGTAQFTLDTSANATFAGDVTLNTGTAKKLSILASTHDTNTAQTATLELGYTHSGGAAAGNIVLTEASTNAFDADMTFGLPHNNGSGGSTTRTALTLDGGTLSATFAGTISATNLSGTNTGDQDLSGYSTTSHNHDGRYLRTHARYQDDLDTITTSGVYIWDVSEADDEPTGAADGLLTIKYWDSSFWATASFQDFHNRTLHIKSKKNGTWQTDWAQVWTTDQLTTTNKTNYDTAYTHSQAAHAPTNAEQNVQSDWNATSGDAQILNKLNRKFSNYWGDDRFVRVVGGSGADTGDKWVNLSTVAIDTGYEKVKIEFTIGSYDDNTRGDERITVLYENSSTAQEGHILHWYSGDQIPTIFKAVKSIRSASSGLTNTYDLYVQIDGAWKDSFTVHAKWWQTHDAITYPTTAGGSTPTAGSDDKSLTSRERWIDADKLDGYHLSTTRNLANTVPVRDANGYLQLGWINTTSGATTATINKIYVSDDNYIRYITPATFRTDIIGGHFLPLSGGILTGDLKLNSELKFQRDGTNYSNYIKSSQYASEGYNNSGTPPSDRYWLEYGAKGGHHFVLNTDGGAGSAENSYDDFTIWNGAVDGDRLFEVTNAGNTNITGGVKVIGSIESRKNIVSNSNYNIAQISSTRTTDDYGGLNKIYAKLDVQTPGPNTDGASSAHGLGHLSIKLADNAGNSDLVQKALLRHDSELILGGFYPQTSETELAGLTIRSRYAGSNRNFLRFQTDHSTTTTEWTMAKIYAGDGGNFNGKMYFQVATGSNASDAYTSGHDAQLETAMFIDDTKEVTFNSNIKLAGANPYIIGGGSGSMRIKHTSGQTMYIRPDETGSLSFFEGANSQSVYFMTQTPTVNNTANESAQLKFHTRSKQSDGQNNSRYATIKHLTHNIGFNYTTLDFAGSTKAKFNMPIEAAGGLYHTGDTHMGFIPHPIGAQYRSDSSSDTGYILIKLPTDIGDSPDDMVSFYVDIYDYTTNEMISVFVGGYTYTTSNQISNYWYNCTAIINTKLTSKDFNVRFGNDGTNFYVAIGETNSVWAHPSIVVRDFQCSYRGNVEHYIDGWAISTETTTLAGVDETQSGNLPATDWGSILNRPYIVNASNNSATATTTIANVAHATYTAAFFDFVIKNGTNVRAGTVYACHNGDSTPLVEFAETSTVDLGDTSDVTLSVDISGANMRLRATTTSSTWTIKSLIRAI